MPTREYNFDGLVGPTHNYSGLAIGNLASEMHRFQASHPKQAALQGLRKMKLAFDLGLSQGVIPPQERPDILFLKSQGLSGSDFKILEDAQKIDQELFLISLSAASMWVANAATVSPSIDCEDGHLHMTVANLVSQKHRYIEPRQALALLQSIFPIKHGFQIHLPLEDNGSFFDEGAANHLRLCESHDEEGFHIFVYGKQADVPSGMYPQIFPARQSLEASRVIAGAHQLDLNQVMFVQQNPMAIDQGVFHNDVIATSNENLLIIHEDAFVDTYRTLDEIKERYNGMLNTYVVTNEQLSIEEAVSSYIFNGQIITRENGDMAWIVPLECHEGKAADVIKNIIRCDNPIKEVDYIDLKESMHNGGGPACLRLRVVLTEDEQKNIHQGCIFTDKLYIKLEDWVNRHYRDELTIEDLSDPELLVETRAALDELTKILKLGSIYSFQ